MSEVYYRKVAGEGNNNPVVFESLPLADLEPGDLIVIEWLKMGRALDADGELVGDLQFFGPGIYRVCNKYLILDDGVYILVEGWGLNQIMREVDDGREELLDRYFVNADTSMNKIIYLAESHM